MTSTPKKLPMSVLRHSARRVAREFHAKENVAFLTIGEKRVGGVRTDQTGVVVYVHRKRGRIAKQHRIPRAIPALSAGKDLGVAIATDVVELPSPPSAFGLRSGNVLYAQNRNTGICGLAFQKNGRSYILTNAHVGCDLRNGGRPQSLSYLVPGANAYRPVGPVIWSDFQGPGGVVTSDVAIARSDFDAADNNQLLGINAPISGTSILTPNPGTKYWFDVNGAEFDCERPEPVVQPANIDVDGFTVPYRNFWVLQMTRGTAAHGQSGSLLCRTEPNGNIIACGLVFGGSEPSLIFAFSFDPIFRAAFAAAP